MSLAAGKEESHWGHMVGGSFWRSGDTRGLDGRIGFLGGRLALGALGKNELEFLLLLGFVGSGKHRYSSGAMRNLPWRLGNNPSLQYFGRKRLAVADSALHIFPGPVGLT